MSPRTARLLGQAGFALAAALALFGAAIPLACNRGGGVRSGHAGASGGSSGGAAVDAATGGTEGEGEVGDAAERDGAADVAIDSSVDRPPVAGEGGTSTGGRGGSAMAGDAGGVGGAVVDGGLSDVAQSDGPGTGQGGAGGGGGSGGAPADGGASDAMFSCGPCAINWVCGGASGTPYTYVTLVPEADGCYLSGLPGHKLLAPDGTITENGVAVARAQRFGPQVGLYHSDGSQWLYCGGNLPCSGTP